MALRYTKEKLAKTEGRELSKENCARDAYYELMQEVSPLLERLGNHIPNKVANLGDQVGRHSWKTAVSMLRNSPHIVDRVGYDGLEEITNTGIQIAQNCSITAVGMFEDSPEIIDGLLKYGDHDLVMSVFDLSRRIAQHSWKPAVTMLENSPRIIDRVGYDGLEKITEIGIRIAQHCWLTGVSTFQNSPHLIDRLLQYGNHDLVMSVYGLASRLSHDSSQTAASLLTGSPDLIARVGYNGFEVIVDFASKIAPYASRSAVRIVEHSPRLIDRMLTYGDSSVIMNVYGQCNQMADRCWRSAVHLLERSPDLIDRCGYDGFNEFAERAAELAELGHERAISFINGDSMEGSLFMDAITDGLVLEKVKPILVNYLNALLGYRIEIGEASGHSTDGKRIYLPRKVNDFEDYETNFAIYKVFATHEEAHLEYGSFDFSLSKIQDLAHRINAKYGKNK